MSVGKGRAGHRAGPSRPLQLSRSPLSPPEGEFPPTTPSGGSRGRARAFLCSSPVTAPAFSLPRSGKGGAGPFLCPRDRHRPCSSSRGVLFPGRRFSAFLIGLCRFIVPLISAVGGQRCSRRGRAAASLPAGLVHRLPRLSPPPSLAVAIVRQGRAALRFAPPFRPPGFPHPSAPQGLPVLPPGQAGRPLRGDRPAPPAFCTSLLPGPGRPHCVRTAGPRALRPAPRPHKPADAPLGRFCSVWCSGPSADRRCALTASARRPFSNPCPLPERPCFARTLRFAG